MKYNDVSSLEFEKQQAVFLEEKVASLDASIREETDTIKELEDSMASVKEKIEGLEKTLQASLSQKEGAKTNEAQNETLINNLRRAISKSSNGYDQISKSIASRQALHERLVQERWAIFRKCRMENIDLPVFSKGNDGDDDDDDSMEVDGDDKGDGEGKRKGLLDEENDANLIVDFSGLDGESRKNGTETMGMMR